MTPDIEASLVSLIDWLGEVKQAAERRLEEFKSLNEGHPEAMRKAEAELAGIKARTTAANEQLQQIRAAVFEVQKQTAAITRTHVAEVIR